MNAFARLEINAIHLTQPRKQAVSESDLLPGRQKLTYLPIVDARSTRILGYQVAVDPGQKVLDCMRMQIMRSPAPGILLMELDATDCLKSGQCGANRLCHLFTQEAWTDRELVIHVRCNQYGPTCEAAQMQKRLQAAGIDVAISWDGCISLLGLDALIDARAIRFDASTLEPENQPSSARAVAQVLQIAGKLGIQTMLAGVSDGDQMERARQLGFDWLQGPLFNRLKICS
jgi:hypothetical protein